MSAAPLILHPDNRLREQSSPVEEFDASVADTVGSLLDTLYSAGNALALSAPQIDDRRQILVIDLSDDRTAPRIYINPLIIKKKGFAICEESCLSIPGVAGNVARAAELLVRARSIDGTLFERTVSGMGAICMQHEMDHFVGKLFIDRLSIFRRMALRAQARRAA